jgi:hypothetical protein
MCQPIAHVGRRNNKYTKLCYKNDEYKKQAGDLDGCKRANNLQSKEGNLALKA